MYRPLPAPTREYLLETPIHKIVRDFPETFAPLRSSSGDPRVQGGKSLSGVEGWESLLSVLLSVTRWRPAG